jgi:hypothetical protein
MAITGVDAFKSKLVGGGARANMFQVTCNFPAFAGGNTELASFMIKGAQLPGSSIGMIEVPFRGRKLKIAGDRTFDTWTITILNDTNMAIRSAFEAWMNAINNHIVNTGKSNPADYQTDMQIDQLDKAGNSVKSYTFRGAFPTMVSSIDMSYDTNDAIEEFTVELNYQYWTSNSTPSSGNVGAKFGIGSAGASIAASVNLGGVTVGAGITI